MMEIVDKGSDRILALRIEGKVEKADMEKMVETAKDKLSRHERLGVYVELVKLGGISFQALVEDLKFAFPNLKRFNKKAVISDKEWLEKLTRFGDKFFPSIEARVFPFDQAQEALKWLEE